MVKMHSESRRGRPVDQKAAKTVLEEIFTLAEGDYEDQPECEMPQYIIDATEQIFTSKTQAYRDSLPSCVIARIVDPEIDITSLQTTGPSAGPNSFRETLKN
jgi:hypothetical protein